MKCKIHSDIIPKTPSGEEMTGCGNLDISNGGINNSVILYNADEIINLEFFDDMRFDENLFVETIVTDSSYFIIDGTAIEYKEEYTSNNTHIHTLSLSLNNIHGSIESILFDAKNGKYIVCFKPKGYEHYRMFGWMDGAEMQINLDISESDNSYKVVFSYESIYPLFQVNSNNFKLSDKYFSPIWQPLYNISYCELNGSTRTGYAIAEYVVKVNQAGQALDVNNQLCYITGLQQQAYKYIDVIESGGYDIIGTYNANGIFDGKPVKVYDETLCPPNASGTITINPTNINLNSSNNEMQFVLNSTNAWGLKQEPKLVVIQPNSGNGNANGSIKHNNSGGTEIVLFQNKTTKEIVQLYVNIYILKAPSSLTYNYGITDFSINVVAEGGTNDFTFTAPSGLSITRIGNVLNCHVDNQDVNPRDFNIVLTHMDDATEIKNILVHINGINIAPNWVQISSYCRLI
jgi:hypothetical protein